MAVTVAKGVTAQSTDPIYGTLIEQFIAQTIPAVEVPKGGLLDALTEAILATSQHRLGPRPGPESLVEIRKVISHWTNLNRPIAFLAPWGSRKPGGSEPDVAELFALRMIECLNDRVQRFYAPGIKVEIGIEDLGGYYLWSDEPPEAVTLSRLYVERMRLMPYTTGMSYFIRATPESKLVDAVEFTSKAESIRPILEDAIWIRLGNGPVSTALEDAGWKGDLPIEQIQFYLHQYMTMYPGKDPAFKIAKLARYWAQSWARYETGAKVDRSLDWGANYINLNFAGPIPGMPSQLASRRVYYRTLPMRFARTHLPPWRAKGYLEIAESGEVTPKLRTWGTSEPELTEARVTMVGGGEEQEIRTDYVITGAIL